MKNYDLLKPYYLNKFKKVFFYNSLTRNDLFNIKKIIEIEKTQGVNLDDVEWLYSANDDYYLIGIHNNKIVTYTSDGDYEELTNDFSLLPFIFMWFRDSYSNIQEFKNQLTENPELNNYFQALVEYAQWCKEQGIIIPYEHLKWLE